MQRCQLTNSHLSLKPDGTAGLRQTWIVCDATVAECGVWAGKAGDFVRTVADDGRCITDRNYRIASVEITELASGRCQAEFFAVAAAGDAIRMLKPYAEHLQPDGERLREISLLVPADLLASVPAPGEQIEYCDEAFVCESVDSTPADGGDYLVKLSARLQGVAELGVIGHSSDRDSVALRTRTYFVPAAQLAEFETAHPLGGAESWAGSDFYLHRIESESADKLGSRITLVAREVKTRLLHVGRVEDFAGSNAAGIRRKIVHTGRWQVAADDLEEFELLTGTDADEWAGTDTVVTSCSSVRKSPAEYEVEVVAEDRNNPDLHRRYTPDFSSLSTRKDVSARLCDFHLSARQCGYAESAGELTPAVEWSSDECPLSTQTALPENCVNANFNTVLIEETTYRRNSANSNIASIVTAGKQTVFTGSVGGYSGNFLLEDIKCEELLDDRGARWTKFTRSCRLAPSGYTWNSTYWNK